MMWNGLTFDTSNPNVYPPKQASILLAETATHVLMPASTVLDVCTGCGIVPIALAHYVKDISAYASDINPEAIEATQANAKSNKVHITALISDLYSVFSDNMFNMITVHPPAVPYLSNADWGLSHGMTVATNGGGDGSILIARSIIEAKRCLKERGILLLLLPHWSNIKKAYQLLNEHYTDVSEIARTHVEFFPVTEGTPDNKTIQHAYELAKHGVIELEFKNGIPYSTISVVKAVK